MTALLALVAGWAFAEAVVWFIVADVPIMAVGALYGRRQAVQAAFLATLCAGVGGVATWLWASNDPAGALAAITALPGIDRTYYEANAAAFAQGPLAAMLAGSFTGVPYKIYALAAGTDGPDLATFALESLFARAPRFLMVALVSGTLAFRLRQRMGNRWFWALFVWTWAGFYSWYWHSLGVF